MNIINGIIGVRGGIIALLAGAALFSVNPTVRAATDPHLFVLTSNILRGNSAALELDPPWMVDPDLEAVGARAVVRYFFGRHYVVNDSSGDIQVIDPATFDTVLRFSVGPDSRPQDILVIDPQTAYVSRYNSTLLYKVNPATGEMLGQIDLAIFADADGFPEMSMMALDRNHLFIQIQRIDRAVGENPVVPSYLAVVDVTTDQLVDVNSQKAGAPGIVLVGRVPSLKMHIDSRARRLFVLTPGVRLDVSDGIEEVDLDGLTSLGFVFPEKQSIGDVGAFVMVSPDRGYALGHTDITESSHLFMFTREDGRVTNELYLTFDIIRSMAYDPGTASLFFPDSGALTPGIHILDTTTNTGLVSSPIPTGLPPRDLVIARPLTPGAAADLRVTGLDPATGHLSISYEPACGAFEHNVVWGNLQDVGRYQYSGEECGIGISGDYDQLDPGDGSYFFLVVGMDESGAEGSYGTDSGWSERSPDLESPVCSFIQDLSFSCDIR